MSLKVWNYTRGYVKIKVYGFSKERFLNLVVNKNIYIWDIEQNHNSITLKISVKAYKMLKPLWKKANVKVRIVEKNGLPFISYRYRKRKILLGGVVFFISVLYIMSAFVWKISITGNERVETQKIRDYLTSNNIEIGTLKNYIDVANIEKQLMQNFQDFSWVSLRKNGTTLEILITENIQKKEVIDRTTPCDVIASNDGIIDSIATSEGDAIVQIGDVVKKGDVLVKSEVYLREDESGKHYTYVHAEADVVAKTYINVDFEVPKIVIISKYTGKKEIDYSLKIFNKEIKLSYFKKKYENSLEYTDMKQIKFGVDYPLPIIFVKYVELETNLSEKELTINEMKDLADRTIREKIINNLDFETDVINKKIEYISTENALKVSGYLEVLQEIDEKQAFVVPEKSALEEISVN